MRHYRKLVFKKTEKLWKKGGKEKEKLVKVRQKRKKGAERRAFPSIPKRAQLRPDKNVCPGIYNLYRRGMIRGYSVPQSACTQTLEA